MTTGRSGVRSIACEGPQQGTQRPAAGRPPALPTGSSSSRMWGWERQMPANTTRAFWPPGGGSKRGWGVVGLPWLAAGAHKGGV
jgi:hypothetical protein